MSRRWCPEDDAILLALAREGARDRTIAVELGRSVRAIESRRLYLAMSEQQRADRRETCRFLMQEKRTMERLERDRPKHRPPSLVPDRQWFSSCPSFRRRVVEVGR